MFEFHEKMLNVGDTVHTVLHDSTLLQEPFPLQLLPALDQDIMGERARPIMVVVPLNCTFCTTWETRGGLEILRLKHPRW